jgi:hypothetical protein
MENTNSEEKNIRLQDLPVSILERISNASRRPIYFDLDENSFYDDSVMKDAPYLYDYYHDGYKLNAKEWYPTIQKYSSGLGCYPDTLSKNDALRALTATRFLALSSDNEGRDCRNYVVGPHGCKNPRHAVFWASEKYGPLVKQLCIGEEGGALNIIHLQNVKKLITLKLDSWRGVVANEGHRNADVAKFPFWYFDDSLPPDHKDKTKLLCEELDNWKRDAELLSRWIAEQQSLESLKLQFLNVVPTTAWPGRLKAVRLRACNARLYWHYLLHLRMKSLTIEEPTSLAVDEQEDGDSRMLRTMPSKRLKAFLTDKPLGIEEREFKRKVLMKNFLEPVPRGMVPNANFSLLTHLTLRAFRVKDDDLTSLLAPFSNLTFLRIGTTLVNVLPVIQSLKTLVLKDIALIDFMTNNVYESICSLTSLESLTLDNVMWLNERSRSVALDRKFYTNFIDDLVLYNGVSQSVKNLTLGFHAEAGIEALTDTFIYLQRLFPNVVNLTFNNRNENFFNPEKDLRYVKESYGGLVRTLDSKVIEGQRLHDKHTHRGWALNTVKISITGRNDEAFVKGSARYSDRFLEGSGIKNVFSFLTTFFDNVENRLISVKCNRKKQINLFANDDDPEQEFQLTSLKNYTKQKQEREHEWQKQKREHEQKQERAANERAANERAANERAANERGRPQDGSNRSRKRAPKWFSRIFR